MLPPYYNERYGPIYSDSYVGWTLDEVQSRHPEWPLELCQSVVRPIPESLEYEAQRDPTIETLRELRMTSEFSKAVITKTNITRMAKFNQYKVTTIFEDYFSEIAEYG